MEQKELSVKCGKTSDSFDNLMSICKKKSDELKCQLNVSTLSTVTVTFWTEDFPELIGVGILRKTKQKRLFTNWIFLKLLYKVTKVPELQVVKTLTNRVFASIPREAKNTVSFPILRPLPSSSKRNSTLGQY